MSLNRSDSKSAGTGPTKLRRTRVPGSSLSRSKSTTALRSVRASAKHRAHFHSTDVYTDVVFECSTCNNKSTLAILAKRTAAWLTRTIGRDAMAMRFRLIWREVHLPRSAQYRCGDCMGYPDIDAFDAAVEINTGEQHGRRVVELMGKDAWPPLPTSIF